MPRRGWDCTSASPGPRTSIWLLSWRNGRKGSCPTYSRPVPPDLTSGRRTTSGTRTRTTRKSVSRPGPRPSVPGSVHHSVHHPTTDVGPELTGAVSDAMSQAIWPVTALHRHHGLDHLVRRKTAAERPSEGTAAPDSCSSPRSVRSGWRPGPRQGPLPPLRYRPSPWCVLAFFRAPPAHSRGGGRRLASA